MTRGERRPEAGEAIRNDAVEAGAAQAAPAPDDALREAEERAAAADARGEEYLDQLRRLAADFDNYKKRQAREREQLLTGANERLVRDLLPVLDDFERALQAFEEHKPEAVREGVALVHRSLRTILEKEGIAEIDPDGARFDPHEHEALTTQSVPGVAEGTVVQVIQRGFKLGDRIVRPARVIVAAAPAEADDGA
jgi:molecular chaperone GrpE